eukprot:CAMPEP_0171060362 /NCGR_PEP_ID=MMETSP0766_2-20121228/3784_1 /TAXON_ID=439317 /ORGANISM="Gambierdiscus australes, Strain CAWD 149" /LENGTH=194 /DNA_ID=CAMNT_0011515927 /DNA_START=154 /DNA_END=736 /DNA_ORIENTATION=+
MCSLSRESDRRGLVGSSACTTGSLSRALVCWGLLGACTTGSLSRALVCWGLLGSSTAASRSHEGLCQGAEAAAGRKSDGEAATSLSREGLRKGGEPPLGRRSGGDAALVVPTLAALQKGLVSQGVTKAPEAYQTSCHWNGAMTRMRTVLAGSTHNSGTSSPEDGCWAERVGPTSSARPNGLVGQGSCIGAHPAC